MSIQNNNTKSASPFKPRLSSQAAGKHLILECWGEQSQLQASQLDSLMRSAATAAGASILESHFHDFGLGAGITGVVMLAESHITVHTWPEHQYAAFDVFVCGHCDPKKAATVIVEYDPRCSHTAYVLNRGCERDQITADGKTEALNRGIDHGTSV